MVWVVVIVLVGGAAGASRGSMGGLAGAMTLLIGLLGVVGAALGYGAMWLNGHTGYIEQMNQFWSDLAGIDSVKTYDFTPDCPNGTSGWIFLGLLLWFLTAFAVMGSVVLVPVGIVTSIGSGIFALATRSARSARNGFAVLAVGVILMFVAGFLLRAIIAVANNLYCV